MFSDVLKKDKQPLKISARNFYVVLCKTFEKLGTCSLGPRPIIYIDFSRQI